MIPESCLFCQSEAVDTYMRFRRLVRIYRCGSEWTRKFGIRLRTACCHEDADIFTFVCSTCGEPAEDTTQTACCQVPASRILQGEGRGA